MDLSKLQPKATGGAVVVGAGGVGAAVVAGGATVEPKVVVNIN